MLELELAAQSEALADANDPDYKVVADALSSRPLHHQLRTYQARAADVVVNSYNTGTGKTKAALLRLLDLSDDYRNHHRNANVLFIAPTNELLRQHERDVKKFVADNPLAHLVLRLDAATVKELATHHLPDKFQRKGEQLDKMIEDPRSVMLDDAGQRVSGHHPYVLVINPDIFYYALYGLGNPHEQRLLFKQFVNNFRYIIVDEFHYYNAKQLANFLFFLTLLREWNYFNGTDRRQVCLLTATPAAQVDHYLDNLKLDIARIAPDDAEVVGLERIPALAPMHLRLYSADALADGLVSLAGGQETRDAVKGWLDSGRHGAIISSALWRINQVYQRYNDLSDYQVGRLTGAEAGAGREHARRADLLLATPTVDIGYNFERENWPRQNIDFLLFDARSRDEFIQRLGRGGRVLGKPESNIPGEAWAVVPDELIVALQDRAGQTLTRPELNALVNQTLPQKNGIYDYIRSGAIVEAFLPVYGFGQSLADDRDQRMEELFNALGQVYNTRSGMSFKRVKWNIRRYIELKKRERELRAETETTNASEFKFGVASATLMKMAAQAKDDYSDNVPVANEDEAQQAAQHLSDPRNRQQRGRIEADRNQLLEEYYTAAARFNFRDSYQPPLALAYDPDHLLASSDYTTYSALHIAQNYDADWSASPKQLEQWAARLDGGLGSEVRLSCQINHHRDQRLILNFSLRPHDLSRKEWEERYCSTLAATNGFNVVSSVGIGVPPQLNDAFGRNFVTFYAVPESGPEAASLNTLKRQTSLFTNTLMVDFGGEGEHLYILVLGTAALLVACERNVIGTKYAAQRAAARNTHIFDWESD
ncbi:MAG: type I-D CRISPR-associated helicase Cas3' [Candidatus Chloroheliales bacterium]|nr:MAG: type I-D CRISPR-associated helicase Cas3' [Chloroflexota bacterium]